MHLFDLLKNKTINFHLETWRIDQRLRKNMVLSGGFQTSLLEVINSIFSELEISKTCLNFDDFLNEILKGKLINDYEINDCFLFLEFVLTILKQGKEKLDDKVNDYGEISYYGPEDVILSDKYEEIYKKFVNDINLLLESINHNVIYKNEYAYIILKDKLVTETIENVEDEQIALEILEYNRVLLKGNIEEKKKILISLGRYVEPILNNKVLSKNSSYKALESEAGFCLNNLHIRHNNKAGTKANDFIKNVADEKLEELYDKTYNTLLMVINIQKQIEFSKEISSLKASYKFKS